MRVNDPQEHFLNLTLKLFNSCLSNEHSPNTNELNSRFLDVLKTAYNRTCHHFYVPVNDETLHNLDQLKLEFENPSISVDVDEEEDIHIKTSTNIVVIHPKYQKIWHFETDVKGRMNYFEQHWDGKSAIQVLLVSKKIWEDNKKHPEEMIQYKRLRNHLRHERGTNTSFIVLFWEDILELLEDRGGVDPTYLSLRKMLETS